MSQITADEVLAFAKTLEGQTLETIIRREPFTVEVRGANLLYTPSSSGKRRTHQRKYLERICETYSTTHSLNPGDYRDVTRNASYTLAVIAEYLKGSSSRFGPQPV